MKSKLRSRFRRASGIVVLSAVGIVASMFLTKPVYAASGTVLDYKTNNANSDTLGRGGCSDFNDTVEYHHPTGSGTYYVNSVVTTFQRSGTPAAGAKLEVCIYQGGSNPLSSSGTFLGSGTVLATSVPNTGNPSDVAFSSLPTFALQGGQTYYFLFGETDDSKAVYMYQFSGGNSGYFPFYTYYAGAAWHHLSSAKTRLKLFGITAAEYFAGVDVSNLRIIGPYIPMYTQGQAAYQVDNGGYTANFGAGTGSLFISDKAVYGTDENVKLRWVHNTSFTPKTEYLYSNGTGSTLLATYTGSGAANNTEHTATISYAVSGHYQPLVKVCGTTCATYQYIYLGGYPLPNPAYQLTVIRQLSILSITGAVLNTYTGSLAGLNTYQGGGTTSTGSIFAIMASKLTGFGTTGNSFLDTAQAVLLLVPQAALFVAEKITLVAQGSALFSFVVSTIHPPAGATYTLPATLLGHHYAFSGRTFTIGYNTNVNGPNVDYLVQLVFFLSIFTWAFRHLMFIHHHKR